MKPNTLVVALGGRVAGELHRTRTGLRFVYRDDYRNDRAATPLSVALPVAVPSHADAVVAPWLRGLLPDDDGVLARWARHYDLPGRSVFDLLSAPIGEDCAGAVQFCLPGRADEVLARPGTIAWLAEADVAARIRALRTDRTSWLGPDFTGQWSLAGHQAKTALRLEGGRWGDPRGAEPTTHILKPAISGLEDHDLNEHLCLRAARAAGLLVAPSRVARFEDQSVVVVERYDRHRDATTVLRVHQEDVCQALGVSPDGKYEADGGPSAKRIVELLRAVMPARIAADAVWRFVDALAWNWIIAGTDAHAKNYSLLLSGNDVRFAPLYDVASALPYGFHVPKLHLAMRVDDEYQLGVIAARHWRRLAASLALDADEMIARIDALAEAAPDAFAQVARDPDLESVDSPLPARLIDGVSDHAAQCRRLIA
jgi:serine/threonine-protein kinase HipA